MVRLRTQHTSTSGRSRTLAVGAIAIAVLTSACSSGGGDPSPAPAPPLSVGFPSGSVSVAEDGGATTLEIRLSTSLGPLAEDVELFIADSGNGSATSGVDYDAFATRRITFPAGSDDGEVRTVELVVLDDGDAEPQEQVRLQLTAPTGGAQLHGASTLSVTIADDEPKTGAFALLTDDEGDLLSNNASVEFATTPLGGSSDALRIVIENIGENAFNWRPPVLSGDAGEFQVELVEVNGTPLPSPLPVSAPPAFDFPFLRTSADLSAPGALVPDADAMVAIAGHDAIRLTGVPVPGRGVHAEGSVDLELKALPVPVTSTSRVLVDGELLAYDPRAHGSTLWTGSVVGQPNSKVFLGLSPTGSRGWIRMRPLAPLMHLVAEPLANPTAAPMRFFFADDLPEGLRQFDVPNCARAIELTPAERALAANAGEDAAPEPLLAGSPTPSAMPSGSWTPCEVELIIETDLEYYDLFGSTSAAIDYTNQLIGSMSELYERHVQVHFSIAQLELYPGGDPFDPEFENDALSMLGAVREKYAPLLGGSWPVDADLVHMLSGDSLGGGIAYVDVLGNKNFAFGVSGDLTGTVNWGTFTGAPDPLVWDYTVVAHEIGHGFGAKHTHEYCPPVDQCFEGCETSTVCSTSTLMSYCHLCPQGLMNIDPSFHGKTSNEMRRLLPNSLPAPSVGSEVQLVFEVRFEPYAEAGERNATLRFNHGAPNLPNPFKLKLGGTSQ